MSGSGGQGAARRTVMIAPAANASSAIDRDPRERIPTLWQVFLDATPPRSEAARAVEDRPQASGA